MSHILSEQTEPVGIIQDLGTRFFYPGVMKISAFVSGASNALTGA